MTTKVWVFVVLLVTFMEYSMPAPSSTTDSNVEQFEEAAALDFNFIKDDLQILQEQYADFIRASYLNYARQLTSSINQTYEEDIPKEASGYDPECLEGIYNYVEETIKDLNSAVAACANESFSTAKVDKNLAQFQVIISRLGEFSGNLTSLINICLNKYPKTSWDRLQCIINQTDVFTNQFDPVLNQFRMYNVAMNGHLMLLGVDMSRCYQQALQQLTEINEAIQQDVEFCRVTK